MKRLITIFLGFFAAQAALAAGGMIGGGEVSFKSILECRAEGLDVTYPDGSS
jgi:hypothetical protein